MHQHSHVIFCEGWNEIVNWTCHIVCVWMTLLTSQPECRTAWLSSSICKLCSWPHVNHSLLLHLCYRNHVMRSDGVWLNRSVRTVTNTSMSIPCSFHMIPAGSSLEIALFWVSHSCSESVHHDLVLWIQCGSAIFKWHFVVVVCLMGLWFCNLTPSQSTAQILFRWFVWWLCRLIEVFDSNIQNGLAQETTVVILKVTESALCLHALLH